MEESCKQRGRIVANRIRREPFRREPFCLGNQSSCFGERYLTKACQNPKKVANSGGALLQTESAGTTIFCPNRFFQSTFPSKTTIFCPNISVQNDDFPSKPVFSVYFSVQNDDFLSKQLFFKSFSVQIDDFLAKPDPPPPVISKLSESAGNRSGGNRSGVNRSGVPWEPGNQSSCLGHIVANSQNPKKVANRGAVFLQTRYFLMSFSPYTSLVTDSRKS